MGQVITLNDLRPVGDEARVHDLKLAEALGFSHKPEIRRLIKRNEAELSRHGEVCGAVTQTPPEGGRPGLEYWLNEAQSLLIAMFSRTDLAADVRADLIRVFMAYRRLHSSAPAAAPVAFATDDRAIALLNTQLGVVREARLVFGPARASALWSLMGLPEPSATASLNAASAAECLQHLMRAEGWGDPPAARPLGRDLLDAVTMDFEHEIETGLGKAGVRIEADEPEGVTFANSHDYLIGLFEGTPWANGRYSIALKRLPGARAVGARRFAGSTHRGVFVPLDVVLRAAETAL